MPNVYIIGKKQVGKTSLVKRILGQPFNENERSSVGQRRQSLGEQSLIFDTSNNDATFGGNDGENIVVLCFDPFDSDSLTYLEKQLKKNEHAKNKYILVQTKSDLQQSQSRQVTEDAIEKFKQQYSINSLVIETSAKDNTGIKQLLAEINPEPKLESAASTNPAVKENAPFALDLFITLAAVGGTGLMIAAIIAAPPLLFAVGLGLVAVAAGTFFYRANSYKMDWTAALPDPRQPSMFSDNPGYY